MGAALWEGIVGGDLGPELRLSATGALVFFLGWYLEAKWSRS